MLGDSVAIITGATGGIGQELSRALSARGYRLVLHGYQTTETGQALAAELGNSVYVDSDISDPQGAAEIAEQAVENFGRVDVVINNAGLGIPRDHRDLEALEPEFFNRMLGVNLAGPWHLIRASAAELRRTRGSVINMSSIAATTVSGSSIPYAVSKAGLEHLTRMLAVAMGPEVRVNAVAPGLVETERTKDWHEIRSAVRQTTPLRRSGTPSDVTQACLSLLEHNFITGAILPVDGGQRLV